MQLVNESTAIGYVNTMSRFVRDQTPNRNGASGDAFKSLYLAETALADDPTRLVDRLDLLLTGGRMSTDLRTSIINILNLMPIDPEDAATDRLSRVHVAVTMVTTSPDYIVQR